MQILKVKITVTNRTTVLLIFAAFILIVIFADNMHAQILPAQIESALGITGLHKDLPWYEVQQWEKDVCSKWGGTGTAGQEAVTTGRKLSWASMSATVQGKKFKTPEKTYIYEVAWYVDSFSELTNYEITMINPAKPTLKHLIDSGSLGPESGSIGQEIYNLTQDFTQIKFTYSGGAITTPIIEVNKK